MNLNILVSLLIAVVLPGTKAGFLELTLQCHQKPGSGVKGAALTLTGIKFQGLDFLSERPNKHSNDYKLVISMTKFLERIFQKGFNEVSYKNLGLIEVLAGKYYYASSSEEADDANSKTIHSPKVKHPVYLSPVPADRISLDSCELPGYLHYAITGYGKFDILEEMPVGQKAGEEFVYLEYTIEEGEVYL